MQSAWHVALEPFCMLPQLRHIIDISNGDEIVNKIESSVSGVSVLQPGGSWTLLTAVFGVTCS